ncbi:MAG: hypothetical protein QM500_01510, partial [Methylococcales bacterium]
MKVYKLVILISVLFLPAQELLAANKLTTVALKEITKPINLSTNQQLYLSNGRSIVRVNNAGLSVIGRNGKVQSTYNHSSLFKGSNKDVWIKTNGKKIKLGVFSRIQTVATPLKPVQNVSRFIRPQSLATISTGRTTKQTNKVYVGTLAIYKPILNDGETNSQGLAFENEVKGEAQVFENIEYKPKKFSWFHVASDSVVATATVIIDENHRTLSINWGDGEVQTVTLRGIKSSITNENTTNQSNAFKFSHVYKVPLEEPKKIVTISAKDSNGRVSSVSSTEVNINARYKFLMYSVVLAFPDHLDS